MSAAACKVPINERLRAEIDSFHRLIERPGWLNIPEPERVAYLERAIEIDKAATAQYAVLNDTIALSEPNS